MKMNLHCFANLISIMILELFSNSGLINATEFGKRTDALEASAWNESKWISAVDAPVVKGHNNGRAADGASWFVSTVKNEQKIVSAKWMTAGLGVYELYVNGKPVGGEFLKPGFTHYAKTKRSFTYDITDIIRTKPNAENMLPILWLLGRVSPVAVSVSCSVVIGLHFCLLLLRLLPVFVFVRVAWSSASIFI